MGVGGGVRRGAGCGGIPASKNDDGKRKALVAVRVLGAVVCVRAGGEPLLLQNESNYSPWWREDAAFWFYPGEFHTRRIANMT